MQPISRYRTRAQARRAREEEEAAAGGEPAVAAREEPARKRTRASAAAARKTVQPRAVKREPEDEISIKQEQAVKLAREEDEADSTCSICFMSFAASGEHRVVALKTCGHIFGKSCVEHWIRQGPGDTRCPICKEPTALREVLPLFVKSVSSVANDELDDLRTANQSLGEENSQLNAANQDIGARYRALRDRVATAEEASANMRNQLMRKDHEVNLLRTDLQTRMGRVAELETLVKKKDDELAVVRERCDKLETDRKRTGGSTSNARGGKVPGGNSDGAGGERRAARKRC